MGFYELKNGRMVELIFDNEGNFVGFGGNISDKEAEKIKKEIIKDMREQNIQE